MRLFYKIVLHLSIVTSFLLLLYGFNLEEGSYVGIIESGTVFNDSSSETTETEISQGRTSMTTETSCLPTMNTETPVVQSNETEEVIHIWCILTKVPGNSNMKFKFQTFFQSLLEHASAVTQLHIITDEDSESTAAETVKNAQDKNEKNITVTYYNVDRFARNLKPLVSLMQHYFSPKAGSYYGDPLFSLSVGLYREIPDLKRVIMVDIDTKFKADIKELYMQFDNFKNESVVGIAPELSPVYRHVLYLYRNKHPNTSFGEPLGKGFPGLNSGVVLLNLERMRQSEKYQMLLTREKIDMLVKKYEFRGHLGDQDYYTLLAMEYPELVYVIPCGWNRQLCKWWKDHGYQDVFDEYFTCNDTVKLYHGNCNAPIPVD